MLEDHWIVVCLQRTDWSRLPSVVVVEIEEPAPAPGPPSKIWRKTEAQRSCKNRNIEAFRARPLLIVPPRVGVSYMRDAQVQANEELMPGVFLLWFLTKAELSALAAPNLTF